MDKAIETLVMGLVGAAMQGALGGLAGGLALGLVLGLVVWAVLRSKAHPYLPRGGCLGVATAVALPGGLALALGAFGAALMASAGVSAALQEQEAGLERFADAAADGVYGLARVGGLSVPQDRWMSGSPVVPRGDLEGAVRTTIRRHGEGLELAELLGEETPAPGDSEAPQDLDDPRLQQALAGQAILQLVASGDVTLGDLIPATPPVLSRPAVSHHIRATVVDVAFARLQLAMFGGGLVVGGFGLSLALLPIALGGVLARRRDRTGSDADPG